MPGARLRTPCRRAAELGLPLATKLSNEPGRPTGGPLIASHGPGGRPRCSHCAADASERNPPQRRDPPAWTKKKKKPAPRRSEQFHYHRPVISITHCVHARRA